MFSLIASEGLFFFFLPYKAIYVGTRDERPDIFGASIQSAIHMYPELNKISSSYEDNRLSYRCFIFVLTTPLISIAQEKKINYS